jgi:hypothetical protein
MEYLLPLLCATLYMIINNEKKIRKTAARLSLKYNVKERLNKETVTAKQLKNFVNILAEKDPGKRKDAITIMHSTGQDSSIVKIRETGVLNN